MPLQAPNLDDRRFADIVDEARALIPRYLPEWTDHNLSDPGITLVQLFAWLSEMLLYRMNRVPERNYIAFLQLIGVEQKPAFPASAEITFKLTSPDLKTVIVPRGTRIGASPAPAPPSVLAAPALPPPADDEPLVFETDEPLIAIGAQLKHVQVFDGVNYTDFTNANAVTGQFYPAFGSRLRVNNALYLGLASNNAFPADEMNLTIRAYSDPKDLQPLKAVVSGLDDLPPATIAWEYYDGTFWRALEILKDETSALSRSGHLYFRGPAKAALSIVGPVTEAVYWLRCRLIDFHYERPPQLSAVVTNTVRATAITTVRDEVAGSSDGSPKQVMAVRHTPVYAKSPRPVEERLREKMLQTTPPTEAQQLVLQQALITRELEKGFLLQVDEGQGLAPWEEVDNFYDSAAEDRHYVLNRTTGEITFGDRQKGAIPLAGVNNVVVSFYQHGGGARGNVGTGAISDLQTGLAGVDSVANLWPAEGGQDEESVDDTKARAPQELKARDRAVTAQDFEFLALETPGVRIRRAHALPLHHPDFPDTEVPGVVTVIVVPDSADPNPLPSESTMKAVDAWLNNRRLLTCELYVAPPRYKLIRVVASVRARATANAALVKTQTEQALTRYLHPLVGGEDQQGWPLGGTVRFSDLFRVVFQVDGVSTVDDLRIVIDGARKGRCENADIPKDYLVYSQGHDISVTLEATPGT
jgi:predicted phage baseplate assembly protein